jgi:hypothetical protein
MNPMPILASNGKALSFQETRKMVLEKTFFKNILRLSYVRLKTYQLENLLLPLEGLLFLISFIHTSTSIQTKYRTHKIMNLIKLGFS